MWFRKKTRPTTDPVTSNLGNILKDMGHITDEALQHAVFIQNAAAEKKLGETLVSLGYCSPDHVEEALSVQVKLRTDGQEVLGQLDIIKGNIKSRTTAQRTLESAMLEIHHHPA